MSIIKVFTLIISLLIKFKTHQNFLVIEERLLSLSIYEVNPLWTDDDLYTDFSWFFFLLFFLKFYLLLSSYSHFNLLLRKFEFFFAVDAEEWNFSFIFAYNFLYIYFWTKFQEEGDEFFVKEIFLFCHLSWAQTNHTYFIISQQCHA